MRPAPPTIPTDGRFFADVTFGYDCPSWGGLRATREMAVGVGGRISRRALARRGLLALLVAAMAGATVAAPAGAAVTDTEAPVLKSLSAPSPATVDVTGGPATFTVDLHITDAPAGLRNGTITFSEPPSNGGGWATWTEFGDPELVTGTAQDGVWRATLKIWEYARSGTWCADYVNLSDVNGNHRNYFGVASSGFSSCVEVVSEEDIAGPVVHSVSAPTPTTLDVTTGSAAFTVDVHLTDAPAGVRGGHVSFFSPLLPDGSRHWTEGFFGEPELLSGTAQDGVWRIPVEIGQYAKSGTWCLDAVEANDNSVNGSRYTAADLSATTVCVDVISEEDVEPPAVVSMATATPAVVDVTDGPATVTIDAHITDALAGHDRIEWNLRTPWRSGSQAPTFASSNAGAGELRAGDAHDGVWRKTADIPQHAQGGTWCVADVWATDRAHNVATYSSRTTLPPELQACVVVNNRPSVTDQSLVTPIDSPVSFATTASDPDGDALTYDLTSAPMHGTISGSFPNVTYTPEAGFGGVDTLEVTATDLRGGSDTGTITINVEGRPNRAPVTEPDSYSTPEDTSLWIGAPGVLANDTDADGDLLTVTVSQQPAHGSLQLWSDGAIYYVPDANYHGPDSFTYVASDGQRVSANTTVQVAVTEVNDPPVAHNSGYFIAEDSKLEVGSPGLLASARDVDGDAVTMALVEPPAHGVMSAQPDGSFTYVPRADFHGNDAFTYTVSDGQLTSSPATVTIEVTPINDPPHASDDSYSVSEDTTLTTAVPGVLANDHDIEGDPQTAELIDGPAHGDLVFRADGSFTYTPDPNYSGTDSFTYVASDGNLSSASATVAIEVAPVDDRPIADSDSYDATEDTTLSVAAPGVLADDVDADGDALSAVLVDGPAHGDLVLHADGSFTYTPDPDYSGTDSFTYVASDGSAWSAPARVDLVVVEAPLIATRLTAEPAVARAVPGLQQNLSFRARLTDADGRPLEGRLVTFTTANDEACQAFTDARGVARCELTIPALTATLSAAGYDARFAGDFDYLASGAHAPFLELAGMALP